METLTPKTATRRKKTEMAGKGCLTQTVGLILFGISFTLGPFGIAAGFILLLVLLTIGSQQSVKLTCSNCGTLLLDKHVQECPGCHATLTK